LNKDTLNNVSIVLVGTTHPGNIGAAARAMKTMGFSNLHLVNPSLFPCAEATARAAGADDILETARVHGSLSGALKDCVLVFGTSARLRTLPCPVLTPEQAVPEIFNFSSRGARVAVMFGRESSGLTNEELDRCNRMIVIPTDDGFSSLNIASAVQIICYEIYKKLIAGHTGEMQKKDRTDAVTNTEMGRFYEHLRECLIEIDFLDPDRPRKLMRRLRRLFNRVDLDRNEYNILRGMLTAIQDKIRQK
jgi:TrmH family RNA methyltransferase